MSIPNLDTLLPLLSGKEADEVKLEILAMGSSQSGNGLFRVVYDLGDYVLKIDSGSENNKREILFFNETVKESENRQYFAEIVAYDPNYKWLIMEKVENVAEDLSLTERNSKECKTMLKIVMSMGVGDIHSGNYGLRKDGTWCVFDYGFNPLGDW